MRKPIVIIQTLVILFCLIGCQTNAGENANHTAQGNAGYVNPDGSAFSGYIPSESEDSTIHILCSDYNSYCTNENGYYYLTHNTVPLKDGSYGYHLMYMDFKTQQEIFLCSNTGCQHDTEDCTSVFTRNDIEYDNRLFFYNNYLYLLSSSYDSDGSYYMSAMSSNEPLEAKAPCLYQMNLDGTGREKIHEFEAGLTLENSIILGDDTGFYFIVKKSSTQQLDSTTTYYTSSERRLIRLSTDSWKEENIYEFDQTDALCKWRVYGGFDSSFVFVRTIYEDGLTDDERLRLDDDAYINAYDHSKEEFAVLNPSDGSLTTVYSVPNDPINSYVQRDNLLYVSVKGEEGILQIDLRTGESSRLSNLKNNYIYYCFQDVICCQDWSGTDHTFYYVNRKDGSIYHSTLVNQSLGWSLEFRGETENDFLVVYDYDAVASGDESYEIRQFKYALIAKDDLYAGNENYRPITMIGTGE